MSTKSACSNSCQLTNLLHNIAEEVIASEIFEETNIYEDANDAENEPDDIIIVHMDIREPLSTLK